MGPAWVDDDADAVTSEADGRLSGMATFGDLLRAHRVALSLTQEELAGRASVTAKAVSALERGERRRPYPHTVNALADALALEGDERRRFAGSVPRGNGSPPAPRDPGRDTPGTAPIPSPVGSVIGRDDQMSEVTTLLSSVRQSLVTLTGPGGVGKTTLALSVAAGARSAFPGGVTVVDLADVSRPEGLLPAIASALGLPAAADTAPAMAHYLDGRRRLLMLDNLEHILGCGPDLARLLSLSPELVVLATSRAPVRIRAEREVHVAPLGRGESIRLFHERAAAAGAVLDGGAVTTAAVATLCERADGLPLAVELAASAAAILGPRALVERVAPVALGAAQDLPARQRSMEATLLWSYDLLSEPARSLLARLSVCVGGFTLDDAERLSADPPSTMPVLADLVGHALVTRFGTVEGHERFRLLEPVRQFAGLRLGDEERAEVRRALAGAVLDDARAVAVDLRGPDQDRGLRLLDAGMGNLRVTFETLLDADDPGPDGTESTAAAAELLWLTYLFLAVRGHGREGIGWAQRLADRPMSDLARARLLVAWAGLQQLDDPAQAHRLAQESLGPAQRAGDHALAVQATVVAATAALFDPAQAAVGELTERALEATDGGDDPWLRTYALLAAGQMAIITGRMGDAADILRQAESTARAHRLPFETSNVLAARGFLAELSGDSRSSAAALAEAVEIAVSIRNRWTLTYMMSALAGVVVRMGEPALGARIFGAWAIDAAEHPALDSHRVNLNAFGRDLVDARSRLGHREFDAEWRAGREATWDDVVELVRRVRASAAG